MGVAAIVQARMNSTRLPGKVLMDIGGKPMLVRVIDRLRKAQTIDRIIIATTNRVDDDKIVDLAAGMGVDAYRGTENDVLTRYYFCALRAKVEIVVRITGDCPCIDPYLVDLTVEEIESNQWDFVTTTNSYPDGLDVETLSFEVLQRVWHDATNPFHREHVTPYILENPSLFRVKKLDCSTPITVKLSVDTREDLERVRSIYQRLGDSFGWKELLQTYSAPVA